MRLALVLSGGGARGAFQVGVLAAMEDAGLEPVVVSGTSSGALNAAGLAAGLSADGLAAWWTSVTDSDVYRMRRDFWRLIRPAGLLGPGNLADRLLRSVGWTWFWHTAPLRRTLVRVFGGERINVRPGVTLVVPSVEVTTGRLVRFSNAEPPPARRNPSFRVGPMTVDQLLASAAIPLLFRPGSIGSDAFWDGGVIANTPLAAALAYEPDAVVVVTTATLQRPAPYPRSLAEAVTLVIDSVQAEALRNDLARAREVNALVRCASEATAKRKVELLLIDPRGQDLGEGLRFSPRQSARLVELGRAVGAPAIGRWQEEGRLP